MWLESRHQSPDEAWYFSGRDLDNAWTLMIAATGTEEKGISAWCKLMTPDMQGTWTDAGITTTDECRTILRGLFVSAFKDGYEPPEMDEMLALLKEGKVEAMIEALRSNPLPAK